MASAACDQSLIAWTKLTNSWLPEMTRKRTPHAPHLLSDETLENEIASFYLVQVIGEFFFQIYEY